MQDSARIYSSMVLKLYDSWVLGFSNSYVWQCRTQEALLPFFQSYFSTDHLDVGAGTGFYLTKTPMRAHQRITLLDLNQNSLRAARARVSRTHPKVLLQTFCDDVVNPRGVLGDRKFQSISLFYLLHCMPGSMIDKSNVVEYLKRHLRNSGVLYGATIIGSAYPHNSLGRRLLDIYNRKGIFGNYFDTVSGLRVGLQRHFYDVEITQHGAVAMFVAIGPK